MHFEMFCDFRKFQEALERCCIQAVKVVDEHIVAEQGQGITTEQKERIMGMIRPLLDLNHPVRLLYCKNNYSNRNYIFVRILGCELLKLTIFLL